MNWDRSPPGPAAPCPPDELRADGTWGLPAPIVWDRLAIEDQRRALVIRDACAPGCRDRIDLAWDDARPFLVGIRSVRLPDGAAGLEAWKALAVLIGAEVRDERQTPDPFAEADANNARAALAAR